MTEKIENPFYKVKAFHEAFDPSKHKQPAPFSAEEALYRCGFIAEELTEMLYAAADNDQALFKALIVKLKDAVDQGAAKVLGKKKLTKDVLTEETDALLDMLYFTYGSFVLMGVNPTRLFDVVHEANMGKMFPDGKAHFDPVTRKILKPADWEENYAPEGKIAAELKWQQENEET